jgi:RHS repeat-associated protein
LSTPHKETNTYGYDALDRLTSWTLNGGTPEPYSYDASGNLDAKAGVDLNYNDAGHAHAVTHIGTTQKYWYDANGNQITRIVGADTFNLIYDAENRLVEVKKNSVTMATFVYDGDGRRVKSTVNGTTTTFVGAHYELTGSQVTKYYFAGAQRVAMRKYTIPQSMSVEYFLGDHLGSTSLTTDANGTKVSEMRYKPWGEVRYSWTSGQSTTPAYELAKYTFTGQYSYMDDPSTGGVTEGFGLMFYNARWYDPYLNQFTQPDSIIPDLNNPQDWDRYHYANNNPVKYTDPSGHCTSWGDDWCLADKDRGLPKTYTKSFHTTFQVFPKLPNSAATTYSPNETYTDFSTGGNPEMVPSLPWAPGQPYVPINDNQTAANNVTNGIQLLDQGAMGALAAHYNSSPKFAQDVDIYYSITLDDDLPGPTMDITGMDITNSSGSTVLNYVVDITNIYDSSPSVSLVSAAPGETVAVPLPTNINSLDYLGGIHVQIFANNDCLGACWLSNPFVSVAGGGSFTFNPYNP